MRVVFLCLFLLLKLDGTLHYAERGCLLNVKKYIIFPVMVDKLFFINFNYNVFYRADKENRRQYSGA